MKSNGGVLSADEVVHQPITTVLSGPAAGALGAALIAQVAGFDRVLTSDGGGTSTDVCVVIDGEPTLTTEGSVGAFPSKIPMIDVVTVGAGGGSIAWLSPEGTLKVGPQSAGADPGPLCYGKGGAEVTITDAHVVLGRIPPHLLGGEIPLDVDAARAGVEALAERARPHARGLRHRRPRDLRVEPGQRAAPGHRQARPRRPRLHADHVRRLRLAAAVPADGHPRHPDRAGAAQPRQRLGVRAAHRRREERLRADPRRARRRARPGRPSPAVVRRPRPRRPPTALAKEGFAAGAAPVRRAPPTCATSGRPSRCGCRARRRRRRRPSLDEVAGRFHAEHRALYGYDFAGDADPAGRVGQPPGLRHRADPAPGDPASVRRRSTRRRAARRRRPRGRSASTPPTGTSTRRCSGAPTCAGRGRRPARRSSRSSARRCRCTPASRPGSTTTST